MACFKSTVLPTFFLLRLQANGTTRPQNPKELYNLRHAHVRNVVERIFGVLKKRFRILVVAPELDLDAVANIPCALGAIHNVIVSLDPLDAAFKEGVLSDNEMRDFVWKEAEILADDTDPTQHLFDQADLAQTHITDFERKEADQYRDKVAADMWIQYEAYLLANNGNLGDENLADVPV